MATGGEPPAPVPSGNWTSDRLAVERRPRPTGPCRAGITPVLLRSASEHVALDAQEHRQYTHAHPRISARAHDRASRHHGTRAGVAAEMLWSRAMVHSLSHSVAVAGLRVVDLLHLRPVLRWTFSRLPKPIRARLGLLQVRLGLMEGLIKVPEQDLVDRFEAALRLLGPEAVGRGAAYLEFGVYVGTSMACMYQATKAIGADHLRLIGFDSFEGMPDGEERDDVWTWKPGQLYSDMRLTRANLQRLGVPKQRVELVQGWFEESLTDETRSGLALDHAPIIMMDCVLESSTRTALEFCTPLIRDRAVVYFDDWSAVDLARRGLGEGRALERWLADHPEMEAIPKPDLAYERDSQAFLIVRRAAGPPTTD
jgi:O-methyltransferase